MLFKWLKIVIINTINETFKQNKFKKKSQAIILLNSFNYYFVSLTTVSAVDCFQSGFSSLAFLGNPCMGGSKKLT